MGETTNSDIIRELTRHSLKLCITAAKEIEVARCRKAILIQVPIRLLHNIRASCILQLIIKELEQKFSGTDVVFTASYQILPKPKSGILSRRARSRTLTSVHETILRDLVYPSEIVGKRFRYGPDGSKSLIVYLEQKDRYCTEHKLETFSAIYEKITGKNAVFLYPS